MSLFHGVLVHFKVCNMLFYKHQQTSNYMKFFYLGQQLRQANVVCIFHHQMAKCRRCMSSSQSTGRQTFRRTHTPRDYSVADSLRDHCVPMRVVRQALRVRLDALPHDGDVTIDLRRRASLKFTACARFTLLHNPLCVWSRKKSFSFIFIVDRSTRSHNLDSRL